MRKWKAVLVAWCAAAALPAAAQSGAGPFVLPGAGCPMAHCDARMSNLVHLAAPGVGQEIRVDRSSAGAVGGLGCVSNGRIAACTGGADPAQQSNLKVYGADGNVLWDDGGRLGATAWYSAALLSENDHVLAADRDTVLRADVRSGAVLWQSVKPDDGTPISPVLVGTNADMLLLATKSDAGVGSPELSIWDVSTGALLWHQPLVDTASGTLYQTINTPAVSGRRAYVLATAVGNGSDGRLIAIDVCESETCGGRGRTTIAWHHPFEGPASASPLLIGNRIFFDGLRGRSAGLYHAVDDLGSTAGAVWTRRFGARFGANAAQDPRGGLWVAPWQSGTLLRLSELNGSTLQTVDVSGVLGLAAGYSVVTASTMSSTANGAPVLTFGAQNKASSASTAPQVAAVDVGTSPAGTMLWRYRVSASALVNAATGQFPIVVNAAGAKRVVFRGTASATFFIGEP